MYNLIFISLKYGREDTVAYLGIIKGNINLKIRLFDQRLCTYIEMVLWLKRLRRREEGGGVCKYRMKGGRSRDGGGEGIYPSFHKGLCIVRGVLYITHFIMYSQGSN